MSQKKIARGTTFLRYYYFFKRDFILLFYFFFIYIYFFVLSIILAKTALGATTAVMKVMKAPTAIQKLLDFRTDHHLGFYHGDERIHPVKPLIGVRVPVDPPGVTALPI